MFKIQFEIKSKMTAYVWAISGYGPFSRNDPNRFFAMNILDLTLPLNYCVTCKEGFDVAPATVFYVIDIGITGFATPV